MASLRERIMTQLAVNLGKIIAGNAVGKAGTTYANTIASVQRWQLEGNDRSALPMILLACEEETFQDGPSDSMTANLTIAVECHAVHDRTVKIMSTDAYVNQLLRDVLLAVFADRLLFETGTGTQLVIDLVPTLAYPFEDEEGHAFCGFTLELRAQYQISVLDPDYAS